MEREKKFITVGEFKKYLEGYPNDAELYFGGLEFQRLKSRHSKDLIVQVEFTQLVYVDKDGTVVIE